MHAAKRLTCSRGRKKREDHKPSVSPLSYPLLFHVALVPNENLVHMNVSVLLNLPHPVPNAVEAAAVGHVVHQQDSLSTPEVRGRDGAKPFLACGVPNLQLDSLPVQLNVLNFEVNACDDDIIYTYLILWLSNQSPQRRGR